MELATEELIKKTKLSPKIIPTSSRWLGGSTKESNFTYSTTIILLPRTKVRDHHSTRYKNCEGEFIKSPGSPIHLSYNSDDFGDEFLRKLG